MADFVATTDLRHGKDDGSIATFNRGDTVTGLDKETMQALFAAGSLVVKGKDGDPNLEETPDTGPSLTTPAMVQTSLEAQAALMDSPDGTDGEAYKSALTQPNEDAPADPASLLVSSDAGVSTNDAGEGSTADNVGTTTGTAAADAGGATSKKSSTGSSTTSRTASEA